MSYNISKYLLSSSPCYNLGYNWSGNMIEKKMVQIGNSWGIVIPKALIDGLRINPTRDKLQVYVENNEIRIGKSKKNTSGDTD